MRAELLYRAAEDVARNLHRVHGLDEAVGAQVRAGLLSGADETVDRQVAIDGEHCRVFVEGRLVFVGPEADGLRCVVQVGVLHRHGGVEPVHGLAAQLVDQVGVGGAGAQEHRVVAQLACGANTADGLANDGAQHHHVALGGLELGHLRREIGGATLEGGLLHHGHANGLEAVFGAALHLQAELIVLVHGADLLGPFFLDQLGHGGLHLVVIGRCKGVLELVERLVHFPRCRHGEEVDHVLLELHRHGGQVLGRAQVAHHHENLVLVDQLLCGQHGLLGVVARVLDQQVDLAAMHAALLVDFVHAQHHAVAQLLAKARQRTGQVLDGAEGDFRLAHALAFLGLRGGGCQCHGAGQRREQPGVLELHALSPLL